MLNYDKIHLYNEKTLLLISMKKGIHYLLVTLFLAAAIFGCNRKSSNTLIVEGSISGTEVHRITLNQLGVKESRELETITLKKNGAFNFEVPVTETDFFYLSADNDDYIVLIGSPGEQINIQAEGWSISQSYSVTGSAESVLLQSYRQGYYKNLNALAEANRTLVKSRAKDNYAEIHAAMSRRMEQLFEEQKQLAEDFIRTNSGSLASLIVVNDKFGQRRLFEDDDHEILELLDHGLMKSYPGNSHAMEHHRRVAGQQEELEAEEALTEGNRAPEFCLPSKEGDKLCLAAFRGKVLLVDFWASWCAPCRKANPAMRDLYRTYKNAGFEILGVSLDDNREKWLQAIDEDLISWPQVSDLKGTKSPVVKLYRIEEIPTTYLLDKEGKIVGVDLSLRELEKQIKALI